MDWSTNTSASPTGMASQLKTRPQREAGRLPLIIEPVAGGMDPIEVLSAERSAIHKLLLQHGALLLRGFDIAARNFPLVVDAVVGQRLDYVYRSTPRRSLGDKVFSATEYPKGRIIPLHSEEAYQRSWPLKLAFFCEVPAERGGETPLADLCAVTKRLSPDLLARFGTRGVRYIRNYTAGIDLSWKDVFQVSTEGEAEAFCRSHDIQFEWKFDGTLRTEQTCQGVAVHPTLGEEVFFNQAHLFHVSSLGEEMERHMRDLFGENDLPRHATFGDGTPIGSSDLDAIRAALDQERIEFTWQTQDLLLVDNMQVLHGRNAFSGRRSVLVAMTDHHCPMDLTLPRQRYGSAGV